MKKRFTLYSSFCLLFLLLCMSAVYAKKIKVASPGNNNDIQPAIQNAVNAAKDGDMIELPAGTFVLNKSVVVTKFISISGQGITRTILYRAESVEDNTLSYDAEWEAMFRYDINDSVRSSHIIIADICFKSKEPSLVEGDGKSKAADMGVEMIKCLDFVITRCKFQYFGNGGVTVIHEDTKARGLIYKNEFLHNAKGVTALGLGYGVVIYGDDLQWVADPKFGSSNFIFVEDNVFDYHRHSIAAGGSALYVFRHNIVLNNVAAFAASVDGHEARMTDIGGGNYHSTRAFEAYNNNLTNTTFRSDLGVIPDGTPITPGHDIDWLTETAILPRGGEALIHDNYIKGYRFGVGVMTRQEGINPPEEYPVPFQQGYLSGIKYGIDHTGVEGDKGDGDIFMWNDTFDFYEPGSPYNTYFYNYSPEPYDLKEGRDYHFAAKPGYTPYVYPHPLVSLVEKDHNKKFTYLFFDVHPNPTKGLVTVSYNNKVDGNYTIKVSDVLGKTIKIENVNLLKGTLIRTIDLTPFRKGIYFITLSGPKSFGTRIVLKK